MRNSFTLVSHDGTHSLERVTLVLAGRRARDPVRLLRRAAELP